MSSNTEMMVEILQRRHQIQDLQNQLRKLKDEQKESVQNLTNQLVTEYKDDYPEYVSSIAITVDERTYHPEVDTEDGTISFDEVTARTLEIKA